MVKLRLMSKEWIREAYYGCNFCEIRKPLRKYSNKKFTFLLCERCIEKLKKMGADIEEC